MKKITKNEQKRINKLDFCSWCNQQATIIWVHGHGQCSVCGTNIEECCRGEVCEFPEYRESMSSQKDDDKK